MKQMYKFYPKIFVQPQFSGRTKKILLIMKLTMLLLITAILQVSATTFAQKVTLSEKNAPLMQVFDDISNQTGYDFLVSTSMLKNAKTVSIDVKNDELADVLNKIFDGQPLNYTLQNKSVVISQKESTLIDKAKAWYAQITVTGKVTNELGDPMPGATVKQKGTDNTAITGKDGYYKLTVPDDNNYIDFSYIGYVTQELQAKDIPPNSVIRLKAAETNLQEVVINKGYYDEKQELSTGDVSVVTAKTIEEQPVTDPIQALEGRVPGLFIQQTSGNPGSYAQIEIRGQNSIANGNDPLYIVDDVPFSSVSLSNTSVGSGILGTPNNNVANMNGTSGGSGMSPFNVLNPNDIETIEILKDADATAIYGARGANGVIIITTKKGKAGATHVDARVQSGASSAAKTLPLLNTQQYLEMRDEAFHNDGFAVPNILTDPGDANYDVDGVWNQNSYTNWQKVFIGNTDNFTNAQIDLSGGSANTQFRIGTGFNTQGTVFPGDYNDRKASGSFSLTHSSGDQKFHAQFTINYGYDDDILPTVDFTGYISLAPDAPELFNSDGSINWAPYNGNSFTFINPMALALRSDEAVTHNLLSNLSLSYEIIKGLQLKSSFGYNNDQMNDTKLTPSASYVPPAENNQDLRLNSVALSYNETWNIEPQLSYQTKIDKGQLDVLLGNTLEQSVSNSMTTYAYGFSSDALISNPQAASNFQLVGNNHSEYRYTSFYGRVGYNWEEKYLLNITARRDGSSRFGPGREFGNFGAIGTGWIFSKEKFMEDAAPWLSFGKLRASYGITGSDQVPNYGYLSTYSPDPNTYQGNTGLFPTQATNPYYAWEVDKKLEGGIELSFLQNRISLTADYYRNRTSNELIGYQLPYITGFESIEENLPATVQNTGAEFALSTMNIKSKDFSWNSSFNMSIPTNKLVSYPGLASSPYAYTYIIGQPLSIRHVVKYTGVNPQTGLYTFATSNTNGFPSYPQDYNTIVNPTQKFYGGFQNSFQYKRFDFDVFLEFVKQVKGNYFASSPATGLFNQNIPVFAMNTWRYPGSNNVLFERSTTGNAGQAVNFDNELNTSNYAYSDGSFIRLKNVSLSYMLPENLQNALHLKSLRVYMQAQNLVTFTHYLGIDPESGTLGLPPLRTITAGLQASL